MPDQVYDVLDFDTHRQSPYPFPRSVHARVPCSGKSDKASSLNRSHLLQRNIWNKWKDLVVLHQSVLCTSIGAGRSIV